MRRALPPFALCRSSSFWIPSFTWCFFRWNPLGVIASNADDKYRVWWPQSTDICIHDMRSMLWLLAACVKYHLLIFACKTTIDVGVCICIKVYYRETYASSAVPVQSQLPEWLVCLCWCRAHAANKTPGDNGCTCKYCYLPRKEIRREKGHTIGRTACKKDVETLCECVVEDESPRSVNNPHLNARIMSAFGQCLCVADPGL